MLNIDEFESVFRSAIKDAYEHKAIAISSAVLVTDLSDADTEQLLSQVKSFCQNLTDQQSIHWHCISGATLSGTKAQTAEALLEKTSALSVDLIVTYRNLYSQAWQHPFSLGEHLDILLQKTPTPVLVIPHPQKASQEQTVSTNCSSAMVVTDHVVNNHQLVDYAVAFLPSESLLCLTHIEDELYFKRVMEAVSKIPNLDTELVETTLSKQLLKDPSEYIESVAATLKTLPKAIGVNAIVEFGHTLKDFVKHINDKQVELLLINTKDGDQMAMHGLAYPLAIEVRNIPVLML